MLPLAIVAALSLLDPNVDLRGVVVDARGKPVAEANVVLGEVGRATVYYAGPLDTYVATPGLGEAEAARWSARVSSDRRGSFRASGLSPGEYSAVATDGKGPVGLATYRVEEGMAEVGLERDPSRHLIQLKPMGVGSNLSIVPRIEEKGASWSFRAPDLPSVPWWRIVGTEHVRPHGFPGVPFSLPVRAVSGEVRRFEVDLSSGGEIAGVDLVGKSLRKKVEGLLAP